MMFGILSNCLNKQNRLVVNGFIKPSKIQKAMSKDIRHV